MKINKHEFMKGMSYLTILIFYNLNGSGNAMDILCLDSSKVFGTISHTILLEKLAAHGFHSMSMGEPVIHDCLEAIEATYSSCPDLKDTLPENTETWSTDGSSYVISGRHAGHMLYKGKLDYCSRNIACAYRDELNFSCTIIETPWIKEKEKIRKKENFDYNAS
ncbi:hypothetical protein DUI87_30698 [Hirundo rustica rustica]|uniref:Reverse transcriptase domain-containing protein n=1 Tax=Hirundo rustica rustica TaxID=333673 RepID=A0A3M0IVD5_HIRRU|nr:hypothetical protein DUI87_30698 [Hirundo rustica rustica]